MSTVAEFAKPNAKIMVCTGYVMRKMLRDEYNIHIVKYRPEHTNQLSNEFCAYINYQSPVFEYEDDAET